MSRYGKSKVLLVDMQLAGGNILRKLNEGKYYWYVDIEVVKSSGAFQHHSLKYFTVDKRQFPTYDDVLRLIKLKFERPLARESLPAPEG